MRRAWCALVDNSYVRHTGNGLSCRRTRLFASQGMLVCRLQFDNSDGRLTSRQAFTPYQWAFLPCTCDYVWLAGLRFVSAETVCVCALSGSHVSAQLRARRGVTELQTIKVKEDPISRVQVICPVMVLISSR